MSNKRTRQDVDHHQLNNDNDTSLALFQVKKKKTINHQVFADDICYEIISYIDDFRFVLRTCALISKQFLSVVKEHIKLDFTFTKALSNERIKSLMKNQFIIKIISNVHFNDYVICGKSINFISQLTQLKSLNIHYNRIDDEGAKYISELKELTSLYIRFNRISPEGCKYLTEMKQLTELDIGLNGIGDEGCKYLSKLTQLTSLDIREIRIGDEGCKYLSEMKQLTLLNIHKNNISSEGCKYLSEMKQLTELNIYENRIGLEGAKSISELTQLTKLDISRNEIGLEGAISIIKLNQLTSLDIRSNVISNRDAQFIIEQVKQLTKLNITTTRQIFPVTSAPSLYLIFSLKSSQ